MNFLHVIILRRAIFIATLVTTVFSQVTALTGSYRGLVAGYNHHGRENGGRSKNHQTNRQLRQNGTNVVPAGFSKSDLSAKPIAPSSSISNASLEKTGWSGLQLSSNAFTTVKYQDFRISVFKSPVDPAKNMEENRKSERFYYTPLLLIDPSSVIWELNNFTGQNEVLIPLLMWDCRVEKMVQDAVGARLNRSVEPEKIGVLPIEEIRIDTTESLIGLTVINKWTSYASQPSVFYFRLMCVDQVTCKETARSIKSHPPLFVEDFTVYYSLEMQKTSTRRIEIKSEHVKQANLMAKLLQDFPHKDELFLKAEDANRMTQEIAENVVGKEITDEDFVSKDQTVSVISVLETMMKTSVKSSESFSSEQWNSVFWNNETTRPDKVTHKLNQLMNNADDVDQSSSHSLTETEQSKKKSLGGTYKNVTLGFASDKSRSQMDESTRKQFDHLLVNSNKTAQWNGERFIPKPMNLTRVNVAGFSHRQNFGSVQVLVTRTAAELMSHINLIRSGDARNILQMSKRRCQNAVVPENVCPWLDGYSIPAPNYAKDSQSVYFAELKHMIKKRAAPGSYQLKSGEWLAYGEQLTLGNSSLQISTNGLFLQSGIKNKTIVPYKGAFYAYMHKNCYLKLYPGTWPSAPQASFDSDTIPEFWSSSTVLNQENCYASIEKERFAIRTSWNQEYYPIIPI